MPLDAPPQSNVSADLILSHIHQYQRLKRSVDEATGELRAFVKKAKAEGVNTGVMIETAKLKKLDPDIVRKDEQDRIRYGQIAGLPMSQAELFEGFDVEVTAKTRAADDVWSAEDEGYRAGRNGVPIDDSPYPAGSEFDVHWREWWHKGQASRARELGPDGTAVTATRGPRRRKQEDLPEVVEAAPARKRGRPPKNPDGSGRTPRGRRIAAPASTTTH